MTELDRAYEGFESDDAARLRFFSALADAELYVLLDSEPSGDDISPRLFPVEDTQVVLAFDTQERLAEFAKEAVPYVALPGRIIAQLLSDAGLGLGLNLDVATSSTLLPTEALRWLVDTLEQNAPGALEAQSLVSSIMEVSIRNIHFQSWLFFFLDQEAIACLDREEPEWIQTQI